jgi:histidinol-phosphate/aromatic aminotransferase/cobyric acid decarboxylase-like protein
VVRADHRVLAIPAPSFIGFTTIAAAVDVARLTYPVDSMMGPNQDREAWRILARNPDVLPVICTPNNPTGHELDRDSLLWTVDQFHPRQAIVDLTYDPFSADALSRRAAVLADAGAVSLLSLSKAFCLAGVRLGVVIADAETIAALSRRVERFHLDVFQHAVLDELVEVDTMSRLTGVREATIRLRDAIARRVATTFPHLPVAAAVGNFVVCRPSQEFPCPCCAWVLDELECGYFRSINLVRLTASGHNLHRLDHVREDASGPADEFARQ